MIDVVVPAEYNLPRNAEPGTQALLTFPTYAVFDHNSNEPQYANGRMALYTAGPNGWHFTSWVSPASIPGQA